MRQCDNCHVILNNSTCWKCGKFHKDYEKEYREADGKLEIDEESRSKLKKPELPENERMG